MLSKQDYLSYLQQIQAIERQMMDVYGQCLGMAQDQEIRHICAALMKQEGEHVKLVEELKLLFS